MTRKLIYLGGKKRARIALSDFKAYYKIFIIKSVVQKKHGTKSWQTDQQNRKENPKRDPTVYEKYFDHTSE